MRGADFFVEIFELTHSEPIPLIANAFGYNAHTTE